MLLISELLIRLNESKEYPATISAERKETIVPKCIVTLLSTPEYLMTSLFIKNCIKKMQPISFKNHKTKLMKTNTVFVEIFPDFTEMKDVISAYSTDTPPSTSATFPPSFHSAELLIFCFIMFLLKMHLSRYERAASRKYRKKSLYLQNTLQYG